MQINNKQTFNGNEQNYHIACVYEKANEALKALMLIGITVLRVELEGAAPLIAIMGNKHCAKLEGYRYATISHGGRRSTTMRAMVHGCIVTWQAPFRVMFRNPVKFH